MRSRQRSRLLHHHALLAIGCFGLGLRGPAHAYEVPRQDTLAAVLDQARLALVVVRAFPPPTSIDPEPLARAASCQVSPSQGKACGKIELRPCQEAFVEILQELRRAEGSGDDALTRDLARAAVPLVGDVITRIGLARDAIDAGRCDSVAPPGARPAQVLLDPGGRRLAARPLLPLRAGRRYALVAEGLTAEEIAAARSTVLPAESSDPPSPDAPSVPPGTWSKPFAAASSDRELRFDAAAARQLLTRLEEWTNALPAPGASAGVQVELPGPLSPARLVSLRLLFVPADGAPTDKVLARFRTLDARNEMRANRQRLDQLACRSSVAREESAETLLGLGAGLPHDHVARVLHGTVPSLEIARDATANPLLGLPARRARIVDLPFLLSLPSEYGDATPLVVLVSGHHGRAASMLATHAEPLAARGMAALALDLPDHGERSRPDEALVDVKNPALLARGVRQAATDVIAVVRQVLRCGIPLADGARFRPSAIRYLGYSLGGVVGAVVRALEPELGATVLIAPGGGIEEWQLVQLPGALGASTFLVCGGGAQHGQSCSGPGACAFPGECIADPQIVELQGVLRFPYALALSGADPLAFATERTGVASKAPLLLITGGNDLVLNPLTATRLADAYGMRSVGPHTRRGPHSIFVQWPDLDHMLVTDPRVLEQAYTFLASNGRRLLPPQRGSASH